MRAVSRQVRANRRHYQPGPRPPAGEVPSGEFPSGEVPPGTDSAPGLRATWTVRGLLLSQAAGFMVLASIHFDFLVGGYRDPPAGATELVIVAAVVVALVLTWGPPPRGRRVATAAQLFEALGVLVGLVTMTVGVERGTILEVAVNVVLLLAVGAGLVATTTWRRERTAGMDAS
jgi:hypothetical protein